MAGPPLPPGPRTWGVLSNAISAARFAPGYLQRVAARYGDIACIKAGPVRVYLLSSPELAQDLLETNEARFEKGRAEQRVTRRLLGEGVLASEGEFHRRQHALIEPLLHGAALERFAPIVVERAVRMQEAWQDGQVVDLWDRLIRTMTEIMVEALFGVSVDAPAGAELLQLLNGAVDAVERLPFAALRIGERLPFPRNRRFEEVRARLDAVLLGLVAERRGDRRQRGDLLSSLARARHPDGEPMPDRLVRDEALTLFRAAKTTGTALSWTWHLLSRHPDPEARLLDEIDTVVGDELPSASDLARLTYCRRVLDEALRLFPPAWISGRRPVAEHEIGGYVIPVGSTVATSPWVIHRDARVHPAPERFDPDRFSPERRAGWHPFAYFPFGGGSRTCLGDEFAPLEALMLLATVGRRWRLRPVPGHEVRPAAKAILRPRGGLPVVLQRRAQPVR